MYADLKHIKLNAYYCIQYHGKHYVRSNTAINNKKSKCVTLKLFFSLEKMLASVGIQTSSLLFHRQACFQLSQAVSIKDLFKSAQNLLPKLSK
jgi:hypothetical protein